MDKSLLIHFNNTPLNVKKLFLDENVINFNYNNENYSNLDEYISKEIIAMIKEKCFDIIYIKDTLSSNYLELYGLRLAYHIRFEERLKYIPIVILSDIDGFILNRLEASARILFTKKLFILENNKKAFDDFSKKKIEPLSEEEYKDNFLDLITVEPPENSSNHDISNEWAIYRWAEFLKVDSKAIRKNREKIASMLYFKYLLAKNPILKSSSITSCVYPVNTGNILYIDDEYNKGWSYILKSYFKENSKTKFDTFEYNFKHDNTNTYTLIQPIRNKILSCSPDIIILDLRLTKNDKLSEQRSDIDSFSGIKIRQLIKEISPAIQVIMFTATSKSVILDKLYEHDILGYIKKEHPNDKNLATSDNFAKLARLTSEGFEKSYLKEVWKIQQTIKPFSSDIKIEINSIFEILNSDMQNRFIYAMFAIFKCIEIVNDYYIIDGYKKATWKDTQEEFSDNSTKNKICMILDKKLNFKNRDEVIYQNIEEIIKIRNNTIHPKKRRVDEINQEHILTWFKMLQTILKKIKK